MTFAEKLRELRDAAGLSEAKLAQASGVSFASVHEYGLGRRKPSLAAAVKIARALGVSCEAFADCEDVAGEPAPKAGRPKKPRGRQKGK
jgi:transcriptional regulator with XRE-family HTH domain